MGTKKQMGEMIDKLANSMKQDDQLQQAIWKWQSRFLFRRQIPQEILKTNLELLDAENQDPDAPTDAPILTERVDAPDGSSSDDDNSEEEQKDEQPQIED